MVKIINPLGSEIDRKRRSESERLQRKGQQTLELARDRQSYIYNSGQSIIIEKTLYTDLDMLNTAIRNLNKPFNKYVSDPLHITVPASYVDIKSLVNGKHLSTLTEFEHNLNMIEQTSNDSFVYTHISVYIEGLKDSNKASFTEYIFKDAKSIRKLMRNIIHFNMKMRNIKKSKPYKINKVYYEDIILHG